MIEHLRVLQAVLETLDYPVHLVDATGQTGAYLVLWTPPWGGPDEMPVAGRSSELDTPVRITAVTAYADGVLIMLQRVRDLLSPNLTATRLAVPGRSTHIRYVRSETADVARDITLTTTNRHPAFGVDTYQLISEESR